MCVNERQGCGNGRGGCGVAGVAEPQWQEDVSIQKNRHILFTLEITIPIEKFEELFIV